MASGAVPDDPVRVALAQGWRVLPTDPAEARRRAETLLQDQPGLAAATLLLAAALRRGGDVAAAHDRLRVLIERHPPAAIPWFEWGMILAAQGQNDRARKALLRAVELEPGFTAAWRALGDILLIDGDGPAAGAAYAHAARAGAASEPALANPGALLCAGREAQAEAVLRAHLRARPQPGPADLRAMHLLGEAATRTGRLIEAEAVFQECLAIAPAFADATHSLAVLLYVQRRFADARPHFEALLAVAPFQSSLRVLLTVCMVETGDYDAALPHYDELLATWRDQPRLWLLRAHALKTLGREADAAGAYRICIAQAPTWSAGAYLSLADLKTVPFAEAEITAMRAAASHPKTPAADAAQLHYALGRAAEQRRDYAGAFDHIAQGARLRRAGITYDPGTVSAYGQAARAVFTLEFFAARAGGGCPSAAPIFIVGMPRAGSTLVEQILASHPEVEGTSELKEIGAIASDLRAGRALADLPAIVATLDEAARTRLGERYLANTAQFRRLGRPYFIDKMPDNFLHAGLIRLILPHARIVDIRRAPMAAGLAAFQQYFQAQQTGQDYTYDLTEIGRYTRDYMALMAHFDAVLPGHVHRMRYEALVLEPETEIRRLLAYAGLAFDPACLRFWETARPVQTPSAQQVRRPIFRDGLDHWRHYEPWLGPLRAALGPLAETASASTDD
jgi:tetratricopeptide (TPR) repeat protein